VIIEMLTLANNYRPIILEEINDRTLPYYFN